ncbi:MAG: Ig-like domain-containing protein [Methanobrevibacter wolinii]|nr:Ig-like domain-containing protein [Methanobrevibacter wolinii]
MKNYNKFIILSLFIIILVCITSVSATDSSNNTVLTNIDNSSVSVSSSDIINEVDNTNENITNDNTRNITENETINNLNTSTDIDVVNSSGVYDPINITVNVSTDNNKIINIGNVTIKILNGNITVFNQTKDVKGNKAIFTWTPSNIGNYTIIANYNNISSTDNVNYIESQSQKNCIAIPNNNLNLTADNITMYCRNGTKLVVIVRNSNGDLVKNASVIINILGVNYKVLTDNEGKAYLQINLHPGDYNVITSIPDTNIKCNSSIKVLKWDKSKLNVKVSNLNKEYKDSKTYTVLVTYDGKPIVNQDIYVKIGKSNYKIRTNNNGIAYLAINLAPKSYIATATLNQYGIKISKSSKITVYKWNKKYVNLNIKKLTKTFQDPNAPFTATLTYRGKSVSGEKVFFTIAGRTYTKLTNSKGVAIFSVNSGVGRYGVTAKINSAGVYLAKKTTVTVNKASVLLSFKNVYYNIYVNNNKYYLTYHLQKGKSLGLNFTFNKKAMSGKYVTVGVNSFSKYVIKKTDRNGFVYYLNKNLKLGKNNFVVTYYSNDRNFNSLRWNIPIYIEK